jgi:hypothetical protein
MSSKKKNAVTPDAALARLDRLGVAPAAYKLKPAAQYLGGLSIPTMHRLCQRGLLRPCRNIRHLLFSREELDRFLKDGMT